MCCVLVSFFFFKQKTAYEMRISDWSSDVCSSDLGCRRAALASCSANRWGCHPSATRACSGSGAWSHKIGRASCRERSGSVRVDLGGRRIINKKTKQNKNTRIKTDSDIHYIRATANRVKQAIQ